MTDHVGGLPREYVTAISVPTSGDGGIQRLHSQMREPEPVPELEPELEAEAGPYAVDPLNPTDAELSAAIHRGLADGSLIDAADWLARNEPEPVPELEPELEAEAEL
jgi:hypothetical protein